MRSNYRGWEVLRSRIEVITKSRSRIVNNRDEPDQQRHMEKGPSSCPWPHCTPLPALYNSSIQFPSSSMLTSQTQACGVVRVGIHAKRAFLVNRHWLGEASAKLNYVPQPVKMSVTTVTARARYIPRQKVSCKHATVHCLVLGALRTLPICVARWYLPESYSV